MFPIGSKVVLKKGTHTPFYEIIGVVSENTQVYINFSRDLTREYKFGTFLEVLKYYKYNTFTLAQVHEHILIDVDALELYVPDPLNLLHLARKLVKIKYLSKPRRTYYSSPSSGRTINLEEITHAA